MTVSCSSRNCTADAATNNWASRTGWMHAIIKVGHAVPPTGGVLHLCPACWEALRRLLYVDGLRSTP